MQDFENLNPLQVLLVSLVIVASEGGEVNKDQIQTLSNVFEIASGQRPNPSELQQFINAVRSLDRHDWPVFYQNARLFSLEEKEMIVLGCMAIAGQSNHRSQIRRERMADAMLWIFTFGLGLTMQQVSAIVDKYM